jgi:hypothetical protein
MRWLPVAVAVAGGCTTTQAAEKTGVPLGNVKRWRANKRFQAKVREMHDQAVAEATARLSTGLTEAADKLLDLMRNARHESTQLKAATALLQAYLRLRHDVELAGRVAELERRAGVAGD